MPDPRETRYQAGHAFGEWTLVKLLGSGGNGEVWRASNGGQAVALKVLYAEGAERFDRFAAEIEALRMLGNRDGIIPILDSFLPAQPTADQPPWLVMPLAVPLADQLGANPTLEEVVATVAAIARILAALQAEHAMSHRDIKPNNLYWYDGRWAVGDFGLVKYPGRDQITQEDDRWLGARNFLAPEMIDRPYESDGGPADVYSLAKTLYALAIHREYPDAGVLAASPAGTDKLPPHLRDHPRWQVVHLLLEEATSQSPEERPVLERFADELELWGSGQLGRKPFRNIDVNPAGEFQRTFRQLDRVDCRRCLRTLYLLDEDSVFPWLNRRELELGEWWVDVSGRLSMMFEVHDGRIEMLLCQESEDDRGTLLFPAGREGPTGP